MTEPAYEIHMENCPRCGEPHCFAVDALPETGQRKYLPCPNVSRLYRLTKFDFDSTPGLLPAEAGAEAYLKWLHGQAGTDGRLARWKKVSRRDVWVVEEFNDYLQQVLTAYVQGLFYPSMTGACCLAERVMNRLVFRLKTHFKTSRHYGKIHDRTEKEQRWALLIQILTDWKVFDKYRRGVAKKLHRYRTDSVHYVPDYDFQVMSERAIELVIDLIDSLFAVSRRKDIFRVFEIPGEIWVRADAQAEPFVQEFVIPCCTPLAATHRLLGPNSYDEDGAAPGPMTEEAFIAQRKDYQGNPQEYRDGRTPKEVVQLIEGAQRTFVIP